MIPGAFLLCANPGCTGVTWEAICPQEPDVPRNKSFTYGELTFSHTGDRSKKKERFKKHTGYLIYISTRFHKLLNIHFYKISGNFRASYKHTVGRKRKKTTEWVQFLEQFPVYPSSGHYSKWNAKQVAWKWKHCQHNFPIAGSKEKYLLHPVTKIKSQTQAEHTRPRKLIHALEGALPAWTVRTQKI